MIGARVDLETGLGLAFHILWLAVIANLLYCVAYPIDLFVQMSDFQALWRRTRWGVLIAGTFLAGTLTYFVLGGPYVFGVSYMGEHGRSD